MRFDVRAFSIGFRRGLATKLLRLCELSLALRSRPLVMGALVFCIALSVFFARRPEIILNPQLWAEDGTIWYADAYNLGPFRSLLIPYTAYFQTFSRAVFGIGLLFPMEYVPLWANLIGLMCRCVLPIFFFSSRFQWVDWRVKVLVGIYYCLMPHLAEVHANITNTQTYLGLYLLLLVLAERPKSWRALFHDLAALVICGLSCPIIVFTVPCWIVRECADLKGSSVGWREVVAKVTTPFSVVMFAIALIQTVAYILTVDSQRGGVPTGATFGRLMRIVAGRIFAGFITPYDWLQHTTRPVLAAVIFGIGAAILILTIVRGDWRSRCLVLFPVLIMAATLYNPVARPPGPTWPVFLQPNGTFERYFVTPNLCWFAILLQFTVLYGRWFRMVAFKISAPALVLLLLPAFRISPLPDFKFSQEVERFKSAPSGQKVVLTILPPGWSMVLLKK